MDLSYQLKCFPIIGFTDETFLIASHIKAWRDCNLYSVRLDGEIELPIAPHIDKLLDKGLITFDDNGILLVSKSLNTEVRVG